jgi:16S rRNA (guanine966-N2)-methyltransferase
VRIIAGKWRGHRLKPIKGRNVRPTTDRIREAWMAALAPRLPGARVLDLYAGSGALGLEALSRGAREVVFVERSRKVLGTLRANVSLLGADDQCRVVAGDAMAYLRKLEVAEFDLILADPPYETGIAGSLLELFAEKGFARELWVEHRSSEAMPPLPGLRQRRYGDTTLSTLMRDE